MLFSSAADPLPPCTITIDFIRLIPCVFVWCCLALPHYQTNYNHTYILQYSNSLPTVTVTVTYHPSASSPKCSSLYFCSLNSVSRSMSSLMYEMAFSTLLAVPTHTTLSVVHQDSLEGMYTSTP